MSTEDLNIDSNLVTPAAPPGYRVVHVAQCRSTNLLARDAVRDGAASGTVFTTDDQTEGRGRHGRTWVSSAGQNLLFSLVLRPGEPVSEWGRYGMMAGLAVTDALSDAGAGLKWPNDIVVDGRKCGGILLERVHSALVIGIGLNVNQTDFPGDYAVEPVSVALCVGRPVSREALFHAILRGVTRWQAAGGNALRSAYRERLVHLGSRVSVRPMDGAQAVEGTAVDVAADGALVVDVRGELQTFHAGDVTLRPA